MEAKESELNRRITEFMDGIRRDFENEAVSIVIVSSELEDTEIHNRSVSYGSRFGVVAAYTSLWKDPEDSALLKAAKDFVEYKNTNEL